MLKTSAGSTPIVWHCSRSRSTYSCGVLARNTENNLPTTLRFSAAFTAALDDPLQLDLALNARFFQHVSKCFLEQFLRQIFLVFQSVQGGQHGVRLPPTPVRKVANDRSEKLEPPALPAAMSRSVVLLQSGQANLDVAAVFDDDLESAG